MAAALAARHEPQGFQPAIIPLAFFTPPPGDRIIG